MKSLDRNVRRTALKTFQALDTPRSLACYMMLVAGEWSDLVSLRVDPMVYEPFFHDGTEKYRRDVQATELLRKYDGLPETANLENLAVKAFYTCEYQNRRTNERLSAHIDQPVFSTKLMWAAERNFDKARSWLSKVLGKLPKTLDGAFGPGATFESKSWRLSEGLTAYDKLQHKPNVTFDAAELSDHLVWQTAFGKSWCVVAPDRQIPTTFGNRFLTVSKDATKRRGICVEPGVNLLGQLAVGRYLKRRLLKFGIDLENGQEFHRLLAKLASACGLDATVDLSNASDTVCYILVKILFPEDWFALLDMLRSPYTYMPKGGGLRGGWVRLDKFSSMGNGFTFELETLLFCALLHAVGCDIGVDTFVYGDDMIIPTSRVDDALAFLRYCGFTPNDRKTFTTGYFRESCGGDFFNGANVRPYYLKEEPLDAADWIGVANGLWRSSIDLELPCLLAPRFSALDNVPVDIRRCRGPQALGNLVVHDLERAWNFTTRNSIRYFRVWRPVSTKKCLYYTQRRRNPFVGPPQKGTYRPFVTVSKRSKKYSSGVCHAAALLGLPSDGLAPRDSVTGYRFGRVAWS